MIRYLPVRPMRSLPFFVLSLLLSSCASDPADWPHGAGPLEFQDFLRADADGSGKLSAGEAQAFPAVAREFARYDADGDGLIAWNELRRIGGMVGERQPRYDPEAR